MKANKKLFVSMMGKSLEPKVSIEVFNPYRIDGSIRYFNIANLGTWEYSVGSFLCFCYPLPLSKVCKKGEV